jgi:hypothetical protein
MRANNGNAQWPAPLQSQKHDFAVAILARHGASLNCWHRTRLSKLLFSVKSPYSKKRPVRVQMDVTSRLSLASPLIRQLTISLDTMNGAIAGSVDRPDGTPPTPHAEAPIYGHHGSYGWISMHT